VRVIASLDRDPSGKLRKRELRQRYLAAGAGTPDGPRAGIDRRAEH
jgi:hypothetical protein